MPKEVCIKCGSTEDLIPRIMTGALICRKCSNEMALRRANGKAIFNLKTTMQIDGRNGPEVNLYDEIKAGWKTSEWRKTNKHWVTRLFNGSGYHRFIHLLGVQGLEETIDFTEYLKVNTAWFVRGYPKGSVPRLEAKIMKALYWPKLEQFEIQFSDVKEVVAVKLR